MTTRTIHEAPERSLVQRLEALAKANDVRSGRKMLKRDLVAGRASVERLLLDPPAYIETMRVFDLLLALPKWGRVKVSKTLSVAHISPSKTVGGLSARQRAELVAVFPGARSRADFERRLRSWPT